MGLREQKKQQTRTALSWAAIRLIVERGADNVLVEDIAAAAGVSPRTFNNYFASKGEAVAARHLDRCLLVADKLRERPADEPLWDAIRESSLVQWEPGPELARDPAPELRQRKPGPELAHDPAPELRRREPGPDGSAHSESEHDQRESVPAAAGDPGSEREQWAAGIRAMVAAPALQGEMMRAMVQAEDAIAAAVAARTGTDVDRDMYPRLVAAAVMAATNVVMQQMIRGGMTQDIGELTTEALRQLSAGLPPPA